MINGKDSLIMFIRKLIDVNFLNMLFIDNDATYYISLLSCAGFSCNRKFKNKINNKRKDKNGRKGK